jgi:peptide/nickel transport system substrate-binding protein
MSATGQNQLETRWNNNKSTRLIYQMEATLNQRKRRELAAAAQQLHWDRGGYIIWGLQQQIDGLRNEVQGMRGSRSLPLGIYGFHNAWLSS